MYLWTYKIIPNHNKKDCIINLIWFFLCSENPIKPKKLKISIYFLLFMVVYRKSIYIFEDTKQTKTEIMMTRNGVELTEKEKLAWYKESGVLFQNPRAQNEYHKLKNKIEIEELNKEMEETRNIKAYNKLNKKVEKLKEHNIELGLEAYTLNNKPF